MSKFSERVAESKEAQPPGARTAEFSYTGIRQPGEPRNRQANTTVSRGEEGLINNTGAGNLEEDSSTADRGIRGQAHKGAGTVEGIIAPHLPPTGLVER
jgi:hypothetical protein